MSIYEECKTRWPKLYGNVYCGFALPPGWADIVRDLSIALEPYDVECHQVKEKWGTLCFYTGPAPAEAIALIRAAETRSSEVCQDCGAAGQERDGNWVRVLCEDCNAKKALI